MSGRSRVGFRVGPRVLVTRLGRAPEKLQRILAGHQVITARCRRAGLVWLTRPCLRGPRRSTDNDRAGRSHTPLVERYRHPTAYPARPKRSLSALGATAAGYFRIRRADAVRAFPASYSGPGGKVFFSSPKSAPNYSRNRFHKSALRPPARSRPNTSGIRYVDRLLGAGRLGRTGRPAAGGRVGRPRQRARGPRRGAIATWHVSPSQPGWHGTRWAPLRSDRLRPGVFCAKGPGRRPRYPVAGSRRSPPPLCSAPRPEGGPRSRARQFAQRGARPR
jgi:hypothetical protein